jgi:glycosyltransferase involved in cell wall biosynthesis
MAGADVSIVICTRNRAEKLRACLEHVAEIATTRSWEVVVVDNGSTDDTRRVVGEAQGRSAVPLQVLEEPVPGVSRARNLGWRSSSGAIVAYIDDDCYPAIDYVDRVLDRFESEPSLGYLGGAVLPYDEDDARVTIVAGRAPIEIRPGGFVTPGLMICANLAFRREALAAVEGFDVVFGYGAGFLGEVDAVVEDVDAAARVSAEGWSGRYDPDIVVRHHHGRKPGADVQRLLRGYDVGRGAFYAKCALDRRMRKTYVGGWLRLTAGRIMRRASLRPLGWEARGAARYLRLRAGSPARSA